MKTEKNIKYDRFHEALPNTDQVIYRDAMKLRATNNLSPESIQRVL